MNFDLSDDQKMLADQARKLLEELATPDQLRLLVDDANAHHPALWQALADLGFLAANIPEKFGGVGLGAIEIAVIAQELGRANAAIPFTSSIVQAAKAIELAGSENQQQTWLPQLASGETIGCFAFSEGAGEPSLERTQCKFENGCLSGVKTPVADAAIAHIAVVSCITAQGPALALVELAQDTVNIEKLADFDELRSHSKLTFKQTKAILLESNNTHKIFELLMRHAAVIIAFEQIGATEQCLYMARDYALERQIFGRPLASYQAIKHKLADIFVKLEIARSNALYAVWALENNTEDAPAAAATCRLSALDAFQTAARENLQVHGGIGYTFEANCHFYYRRERLLASSVGGRRYWSAQLINALNA